MGIFDVGAPKPTSEEKLRRDVAAIKFQNHNAMDNLIKTAKFGFGKVWENKEFSVQQMFDAFGEDAVELCRVHALTVKYINDVYGSEVINPATPKPLSVVDGRIVVGG